MRTLYGQFEGWEISSVNQLLKQVCSLQLQNTSFSTFADDC